MIKTLIFDFGGVLTTGSYTKEILSNLSMIQPIKIGEIYKPFDNLLLEMMDGKINPEAFLTNLKTELNINLTFEALRELFKKSIKPNHDMLTLLAKLSKKYRLIMLSNNDEITISVVKEYFPTMFKYFEKLYFSNEIKLSKPDPKAFNYVLTESRLLPDECLFIDDKLENVEVAQKVGLLGIQFDSIVQLTRALESLQN